MSFKERNPTYTRSSPWTHISATKSYVGHWWCTCWFITYSIIIQSKMPNSPIWLKSVHPNSLNSKDQVGIFDMDVGVERAWEWIQSTSNRKHQGFTFNWQNILYLGEITINLIQIYNMVELYNKIIREKERKRDPKVGVNEGHFTLSIVVNSYVNPRIAHTCMFIVILKHMKSCISI